MEEGPVLVALVWGAAPDCEAAVGEAAGAAVPDVPAEVAEAGRVVVVAGAGRVVVVGAVGDEDRRIRGRREDEFLGIVTSFAFAVDEYEILPLDVFPAGEAVFSALRVFGNLERAGERARLVADDVEIGDGKLLRRRPAARISLKRDHDAPWDFRVERVNARSRDDLRGELDRFARRVDRAVRRQNEFFAEADPRRKLIDRLRNP